jgi:hypothetical protein
MPPNKIGNHDIVEVIQPKEPTMWVFCFTIRGRRFCFRIPLLIDPFWKFRRPGPGPRPEPWLVVDEKPFEFEQDLRILATMADLSRELSPELGRTLNASIEQAFSSLKKQLPEGTELNFHKVTQTAE